MATVTIAVTTPPTFTTIVDAFDVVPTKSCTLDDMSLVLTVLMRSKDATRLDRARVMFDEMTVLVLDRLQEGAVLQSCTKEDLMLISHIIIWTDDASHFNRAAAILFKAMTNTTNLEVFMQLSTTTYVLDRL